MSAILERTSRRGRFIVPALVLSLLGPGCIDSDTADDNASNTEVIVVSMQGAGQGTAPTGADLFSDVCLNPDNIPGFCSVINDNAIVEMQAFRKDQSQLANFPNNVVFERYRVTYIRSDGRNVPGTDVPYAFDGVANFTVFVDSASVARPFMIVRQQAKLEPPLRQLSLRGDNGIAGALILSTIAQVDFYGRDVAGRAVQVTGYLNISFANFPDEGN